MPRKPARAFVLRPDPATGFATVTTSLRAWLEDSDAAGQVLYEHPYRRRGDAVTTPPPPVRRLRVDQLLAAAATPRVEARACLMREERRESAEPVRTLVLENARGVWQIDTAAREDDYAV